MSNVREAISDLFVTGFEEGNYHLKPLLLRHQKLLMFHFLLRVKNLNLAKLLARRNWFHFLL